MSLQRCPWSVNPVSCSLWDGKQTHAYLRALMGSCLMRVGRTLCRRTCSIYQFEAFMAGMTWSMGLIDLWALGFVRLRLPAVSWALIRHRWVNDCLLWVLKLLSFRTGRHVTCPSWESYFIDLAFVVFPETVHIVLQHLNLTGGWFHRLERKPIRALLLSCSCDIGNTFIRQKATWWQDKRG